MKKRRGFTLIELVMVVAILGVLSSIALVKYTDVSKNSKENSDYITAGNIATAAKLAMNDGKDIGSSYGVVQLVEDKYLEGVPIVQSIDKIKEFKLKVNGSDIIISAGEGSDEKIFYPKSIKDTSE
ncbi:MAG: type II secretion system protein [Paraclostridium sp.]